MSLHDRSRIPPGIRRVVKLPSNRARLDHELDSEVRFHLEMRVADLVRGGMSETEARAEALRRFGDAQELKAYCQSIEVPHMRRTTLRAWITDGLLTDLRFAMRSLLRSPSFTIAAVLALGLGTGSTAAVFSLVRGVVLRPLPYEKPEQLVTVWEVNEGKALHHERLSPVNFMDYRALHDDFADIAGWWRPDLNLADEASGEPIRVTGVETSENLFRVLGVKPFMGRGFSADSTLTGIVSEVVISHRLWQSRFGGDSAIIGRSIRFNGAPYTVVGVMPPGFAFPAGTDAWQGLLWDFAQHSRGAHFLETVARLRPGASTDRVNRSLAALGARLGGEFRTTNLGWSARVIPLDRETTGVFRSAFFALLGASVLLLLIACINVANLLLARATGRTREVAVRAAIGASRPRLLRLFLTESLVLAAAGSAIGFGVATASVRALLAWSPIAIPRAGEVRVDGVVLLFTTLVAAFTALAFGLAPALLMSRAQLQAALKDGAKGASAGARGARRTLVVAEVALATLLLIGGGLLIRSVSQLLGETAGLDPRSVITADVQLPSGAYREWPRVDAFFTSLMQSLRDRPAVVAAGTSEFLPLTPGWRLPFVVTGAPPVAKGDEPTTQYHVVDEGFFSALGLTVRGRDFDLHDGPASPPVVIVNETMARQLWPGENAIGKRVVTRTKVIGPLGARLSEGDEHEIIGVAHDVKNTSLQSAAEPAMYFSQHQFPFRKMFVVLRGRGEPSQLTSLLRDAVRRLDPTLPVADVKTMERVLSESVDPPRFIMVLLTLFALAALSLAAVGIYGIMAYAVSNRRREFGIRLALGARPDSLLRMVVGEGLGLAAAGMSLGVAGAWVARRALAGLLYRVTPWDPLTIGGVVGVVAVVAAVACLLPGRRAAAEDPAGALRAD